MTLRSINNRTIKDPMKFRLVVLSSLFLSTLAHAQSGNLAPFSAGERPAASTEKEIGLAIGTAPSYPGAGKHSSYFGLVAEMNFGNGLFVSGQDGIGYRFLETQSGFSMAASFSAMPMRKEKDGRQDGDRNRLAGMGDINSRVMTNLMMNYDSGAFHGRATLGHALGARNNNVLGLDAGYNLLADASNVVRASAGVVIGNQSMMQTYFGVTRQQSLNSGNFMYTPGGGLGEVHASLNWRHAFSQQWVGSLDVGVTSLRNAAADSPLVKRRGSGYVAATIGYRF
jgi:outer membrane scaffolding protein for murein synthesis (MipA/OmpV family)